MTAQEVGEDPLLGRLLAGKFLVQRPLGAGAMGRVYLAEQTNLGKQVAIKVLHAQMAGDPALEKRFVREAKSASALTHPNIVTTFDFGNDDGMLFIAMELLSGRDLRRVIAREWPMPTERVVHIVGQILGALDEAHAKGIIHRDLKPENVMLCDVRGEPDFVKVCDFGIAKVVSERGGEGSAITMAGMICGTPEYMSPEQARGDLLDGRSDTYAVAVMLYQMVCGELPFEAESALGVVTKHLSEQPVPPSQRKPGLKIPAPLEALILRGLEKDRDRRFASAAHMRQALYDVVGFKRPSSESSERVKKVAADELAMASTGVDTPPALPSSALVSGGTMAGEVAAWPRRPSRASWMAIGSVALALGGVGYVFVHRTSERAPTVTPAQGVAAPSARAPARDVPVLPPSGDPVSAAKGAATAESLARALSTTPQPEPATPPARKMPGPPEAHHTHRPTTRRALAAPADRLFAPPIEPPSPPSAPTAAKSFAALFGQGESQFKSGAIEGALASYQEAAQLNPRDARTQRQIGKCYNRLGQRDRAQPYLRRYLELEPTASDAAFIRAMLDSK